MGTCPVLMARLTYVAMLSVDLRSLDGNAVQVDGEIAPSDPVWTDVEVRPNAPVSVHGRLSGAGDGRYYFTGEFVGSAVGECTRCLTEVSVRAGDSIQCLFVSDDEDGLDDDPDVFLLDAKSRSIDVRPAVREGWILAVPPFVLCRDDCKGFCLTCGVDRNTTTCTCESSTDPRWDGLRQLDASP